MCQFLFKNNNCKIIDINLLIKGIPYFSFNKSQEFFQN